MRQVQQLQDVSESPSRKIRMARGANSSSRITSEAPPTLKLNFAFPAPREQLQDDFILRGNEVFNLGE